MSGAGHGRRFGYLSREHGTAIAPPGEARTWLPHFVGDAPDEPLAGSLGNVP